LACAVAQKKVFAQMTFISKEFRLEKAAKQLTFTFDAANIQLIFGSNQLQLLRRIYEAEWKTK
jgi:hypothetical protein